MEKTEDKYPYNELWLRRPDDEMYEAARPVFSKDFNIEIEGSSVTISPENPKLGNFEKYLGYTGEVYSTNFGRDIINWRKLNKLDPQEKISVYLHASHYLEVEALEEEIKVRCMADELFYHTVPGKILIKHNGEMHVI